MRAWIVRTVAAVFCVSFLAAALVSAEEAVPAKPEKKDDEYQKFLDGWKEQVKIQMEAKMREAEYYLASGKKRFEERLYEQAERDFKQALAANRNLVEAQEYLARTQRVNGTTPEGQRNILEEETNRIRARMGFQRANMVQAVADARQLMRDKNHGAALSKLDEARNLAKVLATQIDVSQEMGEINALTDQATADRDKAVKEEEQRKLEDAKRVAEAEHARLKDLQDQRIQRLFEDAKQLFADGRYMVAAKRADEILKIEPRNREAIAFRDRAYEAQVAEDIRWYAKTEEQETAATWRGTRGQSIPYYEVQPLYPADWEEKKKRTYTVQLEAESVEETKWKAELRQRLEERVSFEFISTPLDDVVAFLRSMKKVNIVVDKGALKDHPNLDVTLKVDNMKFENALESLLRLLDLKYSLENEQIFISTKENIAKSKKTVTRFYDVTDLTVEIKNFKPNLQAIANPDNLNEAGGAGIKDIFSEEGAGDETKGDKFTGESLVEFIKSVIAPDSWTEGAIGGGAKGFIP